LLNLFAYSGLASLHAAQAGAEVTHLDASKKAVAQAFENRDLSALSTAPIRFITDDASRFVEREIRRGHHYDGIMLDPPKYGRGPKGEIWRLEEHLPTLLAGCRALLSDTPLLFIATIYAIRTSTSAVQSAVGDALAGMGGIFQAGELAIREEREEGRTIGQALYVRWSGDELR
jgi:23S rRNA (cytosine1962-C5)-methyltransferase